MATIYTKVSDTVFTTTEDVMQVRKYSIDILKRQKTALEAKVKEMDTLITEAGKLGVK